MLSPLTTLQVTFFIHDITSHISSMLLFASLPHPTRTDSLVRTTKDQGGHTAQMNCDRHYDHHDYTSEKLALVRFRVRRLHVGSVSSLFRGRLLCLAWAVFRDLSPSRSFSPSLPSLMASLVFLVISMSLVVPLTLPYPCNVFTIAPK
ncbi:hypothetical protein M404DRAFT_845751 [Pisolithus tinctorius Marx 270]|uniref:Uncharacterized protein n=1 Tax=Pisolithus tinctorius Marx 270 TaxID=870435 RepID=A0A0C3NTT1_PISTI|nr:hypothetical protein M404DRAFT_845751 [Pisolithus tinctorius Marx 270]